MGKPSTRLRCCEGPKIDDNLDTTMACQTDLFQFDMWSVCVFMLGLGAPELYQTRIFEFVVYSIIEFLLLLSNLNQTVAHTKKSKDALCMRA